jgi:CRISPR-associated protein Cas2
MDVIVTYDVDTTTSAGERRLSRVAKVCEGYGVRVQYSVFECRVSQTALAQMIAALADEIEPRQDSVNVYRFAGDLAASRLSLGRRPPRDPGRPWII